MTTQRQTNNEEEPTTHHDPQSLVMSILLSAADQNDLDTARQVVHQFREAVLQEGPPEDVVALDTELINVLLEYYLDENE